MATEPHPNNYCSGRFADWLEVMLLPECNGRCAWCVESDGYHPGTKAPVAALVDKIRHATETNIMLLGGEPLLYAHLALRASRFPPLRLQPLITVNRLSLECFSSHFYHLFFFILPIPLLSLLS